jgi:tetratricopeptide (TPR) repeat protein
MPVEVRPSFGTLGRLAAAAAAAYAGAHVSGDPTLGVALASVVSGYLTDRASTVEDKFQEQIRAGKNHHLQLALAGAFRCALEELQLLQPAYKSFFDSWQAILDDALDQPTTLLAAIIPTEFDPLLDAANPFADRSAAFDEAVSLLRFWLAYQQAFERTKSYPAVPPSVLPELPAGLHQFLQARFLPEFQEAFANLLLRSDYAHRAFERRHLQELVAASRAHSRILERLDAQLLLPLDPLRPPEPLDRSRELEILRAENRAIPVVGRQADLAGLHGWLASPARISFRILTGPAGAGKTRLAIQLLQEIEGSGWHAGFLRDSDLANLNQRRWDRPTLAIVDYAASAAQSLKSWLRHVAGQPSAQPLRVLLLEREADPQSGWLRLLLDNMSTGHLIASRLDPPEPQRVTPLADPQLRREILANTLGKLGIESELPPPGSDLLFEKRLAEPRWEDPLYLMMAALVARQSGGLPQALSFARTDLAFRLADREIDRIGKFLPPGTPGETAQLLTRLAGIVTACKSMERSDLAAAAKEESAALGIEFPGGPRVAADRIALALNRNGKPAPIEPDIIGEAVLLRCFGGGLLNEGAPALVRAARREDRRYASNVCFAITRTCQDFASDKCQDPLDWVEEFIHRGESDDLDLLLELEDQMPHDTLVLRERAARVDRLLLTRFERIQETEPSERAQSTCARLANNLCFRLSDLGRREEALAQAEDAVRLHRQLAQQRPDAFLPDLAMSLNNLANSLSDLGRREEALAQAEEAVRLRRQLAQQRPDAFLPDLARSLAVVGKIVAEERPGEAMGPLAEAIRILTPFLSRLPRAHAPLARFLCSVYLQAAQAAEIEPNLTLLAPMTAVFEELNSS